MNRKVANLSEFKLALDTLDKKLSSIGEKIEICAVGGFAMLYRGVRESGYTMDIDSITEDYPETVLEAISDTGNSLGLQTNWINNDMVFDNDTSMCEMMLEPSWEKVDWKFENINLFVANMDTLVRAKLLAAEDDYLSGRAQDFPDLVSLLRKLKINSFDNVLSYCYMAGIELKDEYPICYSRLRKVFDVKSESLRNLAERRKAFINEENISIFDVVRLAKKLTPEELNRYSSHKAAVLANLDRIKD